MTPAARPEVLEKLLQITDKEWIDVEKIAKRHIQMRLKYHTLFGAHSETRLGMTAFQYYFYGAVEKIYDGIWDWKFEKFSLIDQIIRIINSMISEEVRKSKTQKEEEQSLLYFDLETDENEYLLAEVDSYEEGKEKEDRIQKFISLVMEAIKGHVDYEYLCLALMEGKSYDDICQDCSWTKKELYKKIELMKLMITRYAKERIKL